ncbi:dTDP-glucose 4,6-dehydratase [Virgibacillus salarius]|uniref:dTDP-glucose 4,6-dehydratase n=1 Tax=Virgibacillus salarius TaxID=447199 RepID=UPI002490161B|nr:dTDP-glucose 4,6-dehydratase [Virgibacillus salarius]WBX82155.1 dTDP-glucose 4,6-dehydratase [Virgibacillus salarius]
MKTNKSTILITGGAGFIGANFIPYFMKKHPDYTIINLDKLTYAGNLLHLTEVSDSPNYHFIHGDITDEQLVTTIFNRYDIGGVIHFAAESHVDRSIEDANHFIQTNVLGTMVLLQIAKNDWQRKRQLQHRRFHHISTDEVYGSLGEKGKFTETTPYNPRNPYSASKAGANMLVKSFGYTYGMDVVVTSSSNNYGPKQHDEKLIPTIIRKALKGEAIPIYGDGSNIRDWLYVSDHCGALDLVFHHGKSLEKYNIGGSNEQTNIAIAKKVCHILDELTPESKRENGLSSHGELITYTKDRSGHDQRYAVDDQKIRTELGWKPVEDFHTGLQKTIKWYIRQWAKSKVH